MTDYKKTTELEAVNYMLGSVGEQPVSAIPDSGVNEATIAQSILHDISREIQSSGLDCNTDEKYVLTPDGNNLITLPTNCLNVDSYYKSFDYVERNGQLYDRYNQTFEFTDTSVYVDITWFLAFENLPEHVRGYIKVSAARVFQKKILGSEKMDEMYKEDELKALVQFKRGEANSDDRTLLAAQPVWGATINRRRW